MKELDAGTFNPKKEMLGTGPYEVVSHSLNQSWVLKANPYYWRKGDPKFAKLVINVNSNQAAQVAGLRSGTLGIVDFASPNVLTLLKGDSNIRVVLPEELQPTSIT